VGQRSKFYPPLGSFMRCESFFTLLTGALERI
jgi:hypothetical protein